MIMKSLGYTWSKSKISIPLDGSGSTHMSRVGPVYRYRSGSRSELWFWYRSHMTTRYTYSTSHYWSIQEQELR